MTEEALTPQQKATAARKANAEARRLAAAEAATAEAAADASSTGGDDDESQAEPQSIPPAEPGVAKSGGMLGLHDPLSEGAASVVDHVHEGDRPANLKRGTSGSEIRPAREPESDKVPFSDLHLQAAGPNGSTIRPPKVHTANQLDADGAPSGGYVEGLGLRVDWQKGPLGRGTARRGPNGAFVETVIRAARDRIIFYQESAFACVENAEAIDHLNAALDVLDARTRAREAREVEGTNEV